MNAEMFITYSPPCGCGNGIAVESLGPRSFTAPSVCGSHRLLPGLFLQRNWSLHPIENMTNTDKIVHQEMIVNATDCSSPQEEASDALPVVR